MQFRQARVGALLVLVFLGMGADWPQFLGPTRNALSPEKGLIDRFPMTGPPVLWEREVGEGYASPVIAGERLILFHRVGNDDLVECLDARTGKAHWKFTYSTEYQDALNKGNGPRSTPAISEDRVYLLGAGGQFHVLDLQTGKLLWKRNLLTDYRIGRSFFGIGTSPLIEENLLVLNIGGQDDAGIVAFEKTTGKEVWRSTKHEASYASPVVATMDGVRHLIFFTREGLVSLDPKTGDVRFTRPWRARINASVNAATPIVVGDEIFISACYDTGGLLVRGKKDGIEEIWKNNESLICHYSTPVAINEFLFGFDGRQEEGANFRCVEWKTGKVRWKQDGFGCGSVLAADGKLFVMTEGGELVLVQPTGETYRELARAPVLRGPVRAHLALSGGRLYGRDNRKLVCWNVSK